MTTAKPKAPQVTVGGARFALSDVEAAIEILENAAGIMVRQPLAKHENPLSGMDYHRLANSWRESHEADAKAQTKPCVIAALRDLVAQASKSSMSKSSIAAKPTVVKTGAQSAA
jgi:hypothetical protein